MGILSITFPVPCSAAGGCTWSTQGWWADSDFGDGSMSTFWPMNLKGADITILPGPCDPSGSIVGSSASSFHPGGCNFAMGDGSVRFIRNTVSSWNSLVIIRDANCIPIVPAGMQMGIYQALSTRNGDEMVLGRVLRNVPGSTARFSLDLGGRGEAKRAPGTGDRRLPGHPSLFAILLLTPGIPGP